MCHYLTNQHKYMTQSKCIHNLLFEFRQHHRNSHIHDTLEKSVTESKQNKKKHTIELEKSEANNHLLNVRCHK